MDHVTTRRAALKLGGGALAYAAGAGAFAVATTATSSCTAKAATPERAAWDRAFADFEQKKAAYEADCEIYDRIDAAHKATMPARPKEAVQDFPYLAENDVLFRLDLDEALG